MNNRTKHCLGGVLAAKGRCDLYTILWSMLSKMCSGIDFQLEAS
jgi:hypothetical protein